MSMSLLIAAAALLAALPVASAQSSTFSWQFADLSLGVSTVPQCGSLKIELEPLNSSTTSVGKGPWTMLAYEAGGAPSIQALGSNKDSLVWQVRHAEGAQLLITMLDADGGYGGFPDLIYTVAAGSSKDCMPSTPAPALSVISNYTASDQLPTCATWGLTVEGGTPPYSLSIAAVGAAMITNVTSSDKQNRFTYVNRASPGSAVLAGITDATGLWGVSSFIIKTSGGADTTCGGTVSSWDTVSVPVSISSSTLPSSSSRSTSQTPTPSAPAASTTPSTVTTTHTSNTAAIAGGVVGGVAVLLIALLAFFCFRRRTRRVRNVSHDGSLRSSPLGDTEKAPDLTPAVPELHRNPLVPSPFPSAVSTRPYLPASRLDTGVSPVASKSSPVSSRDAQSHPGLDSVVSTIAGPGSVGVLPGAAGFASGPTPSETSATLVGAHATRENRAERKAREAAEESRRPLPAPPASGPTSPAPGPVSPTSTASAVTALSSDPGTAAPDTIFVQHRDGGVAEPVVVELPPSYEDHRRRSQQVR